MQLSEFLAEVRRRTKTKVTISQIFSHYNGQVIFYLGKRIAGWAKTELDDDGVLVVTTVVYYDDKRVGLLLLTVAKVFNLQIHQTNRIYQKQLAELSRAAFGY